MKTRKSARAVLLTDDARILLMKLQEPVAGDTFWITPGGAAEDGESVEAGLRRELIEETGWEPAEIGPPIWTRTHDFTWNRKAYHQEEIFFLVRTEPFDPVMDMQAAPGESAAFRGFRWWSLDEMHPANETFVPRRLHDLLIRLLEHGPPDPPFDVSG